MKNVITPVVLALMLIVACPRAAQADDVAVAKQAADGVGRMAWDLVRAAGDGNTVVSPLSVWEALAMTHAGARGQTAAEIAHVLGMPDDRAAIGTAAEALRKMIAGTRGPSITLDIANRLWVQKGKPLERDFTALLESRFGAAAGAVDFQGATEESRREINRWVATHTADKIGELMKPGTIDGLTRLVLTNAVYMKAAWQEPFQKPATKPAPFTLGGGGTVEVPFMNRSGQMAAGRVGDGAAAATVCEIPYAGPLAMVVVVPEHSDGLPALVSGFKGDWRETWSPQGDRGVRMRKVELSLPKWMARKPLSLNEPLESMGMKSAFGQAADFSGIDGTKDLIVTAVVHEGYVDVSEEGTEAAAATGVAIGVRSAMPRPEEPLIVKADRPFAWAVIERRSGVILFAGVVNDPR